MGIPCHKDTSLHISNRYLLASLIAMLRVRQEGLEIRELVAGSEDLDTDEEELEMTYL